MTKLYIPPPINPKLRPVNSTRFVCNRPFADHHHNAMHLSRITDRPALCSLTCMEQYRCKAQKAVLRPDREAAQG